MKTVVHLLVLLTKKFQVVVAVIVLDIRCKQKTDNMLVGLTEKND
jgi:hypothetical protein